MSEQAHVKRWEAAEDEILLSGYAEGKTVLEISEGLNRTPDSVRNRAYILRLGSKGDKPTTATDNEEAVSKTPETATDGGEAIYGICRFCGQINLGIDNVLLLSPDARNEAATLSCGCSEAAKYQRIQSQIKGAMQRIDKLFGEGSRNYSLSVSDIETIDLLKSGVSLIANDKIRSVSIIINPGEIGKVSASSSGAIKVERTKNLKYKLEQE